MHVFLSLEVDITWERTEGKYIRRFYIILAKIEGRSINTNIKVKTKNIFQFRVFSMKWLAQRGLGVVI